MSQKYKGKEQKPFFSQRFGEPSLQATAGVSVCGWPAREALPWVLPVREVGAGRRDAGDPSMASFRLLLTERRAGNRLTDTGHYASEKRSHCR